MMAYEDVEFEDEYGTSKTGRRKRLGRYRQQIAASKKWRADHEDTWRKMIDLYRNRPYDEIEEMPYREMLAIAVGFSTINVIFPSVSLQRPKVTITPTVPERSDQAMIAEQVINYWWRHHNYQHEFRLAVKDYLITGHGWVKTTYLHKTEDRELSPEQFQEELQRQLFEKYQAVEMRPEDEALFPTDEDIANTLPTTKTYVKEDHPRIERVSNFDMFVDPDATHEGDMRWIAQRIAVPVAEAKQRKDWRASVRSDLIGSAGPRQQEDGFYDHQQDGDAKFVIVWEHYDLVNNTLCTFSEEGEDFLKDPEPIPFSFGHPFVMMRNYEVPENFYPIGELESMEPLNMELNIVRTSQMNDVKQFRRAYVTREGTFDDKGIGALAAPRDGEVIQIPREADVPDDLRQVLIPIPTMGVNPDTYPLSETIQDDITRVTAVSEYQQGAMPEIRRTATEANIIQEAANARSADKLAQIENSISLIARRVLQLGQQFLSQPQVARIAGDDKAVTWIPFDAESIVGEFDFEVEAGSTQPRNEAFRRQSALQMMDAFTNPLFQPQPDPATGQIVPILDARKVAIHVMREGFGIKDAENFIVPPPPPPMLDPMTGQPMQPGMVPPGGPEAPPEGGPPQPEQPPTEQFQS